MLVAYMTSGNIAVFDHDVRRYVDFPASARARPRIGGSDVETLADRVYEFLEHKQPGDVDIPEVQDIKRIIRESEAVAGIEVMGLNRTHARFLNLPFLPDGQGEEGPDRPRGREDRARPAEEYRPEIVFVAGDLSDPHGTHRMCKEAIDKALAESTAPRPEVWLYRGAWQEWAITDATWLVPMSQEELRTKIQAIFKHQSQKDSAPFPGQDDREFWQRVDSRNKDTAALLDRLGLAEYFAMEAYVVE
jgi:glucosamine-6-phosphate deaminase